MFLYKKSSHLVKQSSWMNHHPFERLIFALTSYLMQLNSTLFIKIVPKRIQPQNLSNCSQNIVKITIEALGRVLLKHKQPSKCTPTPRKADN